MRYVPRRVPRHEQLSLRGLDCHLLRWGPPAPDPLLLLHGWADTADSFQFLVDELPQHWSCIACDWRGFGRSGRAPGGYWFPDYHADLDQLLDALCPHEPARLLGHSMGGRVAMTYAGIRPERVRRLVNLEGVSMATRSPDEAPGRFQQWLQQLREPPEPGDYRDFDDLARRLMQLDARLTPERARFLAETRAAIDADGVVRVRMDRAHRLVNPYLYRQEDDLACWRRVTAAVLLVLGAESDLVARLGPAAGTGPVAATIRDLRIATVAEAGHNLHHDQPRAVARLVEEFFGGDACSRGG